MSCLQIRDIQTMIKRYLKRIFYPGFDLNTRSRYRLLPPFFLHGSFDTLDVGCGNGALSYAAFKTGNRVLAISYIEDEVNGANAYFKSFMNCDNFEIKVFNAYDLPKLDQRFDQIICSETLEHITNDKLIIEHFFNLLKPQGILHLCCPNSSHPEHNLGRVNNPEDGGHVRDGYTLESYATLLNPAGFKIIDSLGIGTPALERVHTNLKFIRNRFGDIVAMPIFLLVWPFLRFIDKPETKSPFSIYVKAIKEQ